MGQGPCLQPALPPRPRRSLCDGGAAQGADSREGLIGRGNSAYGL